MGDRPDRQPDRQERSSNLRGRTTIIGTVVVLGVAVLIAVLMVRGGRHDTAGGAKSGGTATTATTTPAPPSTIAVASLRAAGLNLIDNASLLGEPQGGVAPGLLVWGVHPRFSVVSVPARALPLQAREGLAASAVRAQRETVPHVVGGAWYTVIVRPGRVYLERLAIDVPALAPGGRIDLNLEWYAVNPDGSLAALGSVAQHEWSTTRGFVEVSQAAVAPPGARQAHVVVNVVGGGTAIFTRVSLRVASWRADTASADPIFPGPRPGRG